MRIISESDHDFSCKKSLILNCELVIVKQKSMSWRNMNSNEKKEECIWNAGHHSKGVSSEEKKNEKPWERGRRDQEKGERKGGIRGSGEGRASGGL